MRLLLQWRVIGIGREPSQNRSGPVGDQEGAGQDHAGGGQSHRPPERRLRGADEDLGHQGGKEADEEKLMK